MASQPTILVTGSAGFIGHHLFSVLQRSGYAVVGFDSLNTSYGPELKYSRLAAQGFQTETIRYNTLIRNLHYPKNSFIQLDLTDEPSMKALFEEQHFDVVINLAAQAGVRYSLERLLGKKAILDLKPMQPGDEYCTYADVDYEMKAINYKPITTLEDGLTRFVDWYKQQYVPAREKTLEHS
jgi:nucleoside-diphosphate-sugar epimerase